MTFQQLGVIDPILRALSTEGYTNPTPIQEQSIPILLHGKDLLGCAQTGTGKTAAFAIPILQHLYLKQKDQRGHRRIKALVVTPTRELAIQIGESFSVYGKHTGIKNTVIFGGVKQGAQTKILQRGVDVLVATPGRLLDLIGQGFINLKDVEYSVLDEADRMLDMGFIHDIKELLSELPRQRHSLFFSATISRQIDDLIKTFLHDPLKVSVKVRETAPNVDQDIVKIRPNEKRLDVIQTLLRKDGFNKVLVFGRTKRGVDRLSKTLLKNGFRVDSIHGDKPQSRRQRALRDFKENKITILVATDVAARGLDIDNVSHVINFDMPGTHEDYIHRIGRTGRGDKKGVALTFVD